MTMGASPVRVRPDGCGRVRAGVQVTCRGVVSVALCCLVVPLEAGWCAEAKLPSPRILEPGSAPQCLAFSPGGDTTAVG
jgi:hypothetical protein